MPSGIHHTKLDIPIERVWNFVSDMDNWAPLVPGYIDHKILSDTESTWKFKGDTGIVQKTISMKINITKWQETTKVTFDLTGLSDNFKGSGYFEAAAVNDSITNMTGHLNITAKGMMGPMINSVLKSFVPKTTKDLTVAVGDRVMEVETVLK
ncbi:carbon monoxide dehydrogenase [Virgibacillus profundi]|uniref:Carbon monoxide dehydrogenase n=1 Tax=Virgibacillus profundi TaxID=2024555 RepID=A0A2A2II96_9BACI|nr:SRPBCC family protein [Virgibacillus profundi]PAV30880.1 carbon monoxide dehydrogenase [Virgibacillus profundi]PXY55063.1 SRPBCC family protein [Virgibacillus profundi]